MFNVTVIKMKDLIKYFVGFILTVVIVGFLTKYVMSNSENMNMIKQEIGEKFKMIFENSFTGCLDETIPGIKQANKEYRNIAEENDKQADSINLLQEFLKVELGILEEIEEEEIVEVNTDLETNVADDTTNNETADQENNTELADTNVETQVVTENPLSSSFTNEYSKVKIKNESKYDLTEEILNPDITVENKNIVLFHTHTCESYTSSEQFSYTPTGTYRTTDKNFTVCRVGDELEKYLKEYNYNVIHDTTYHDYPSYTGSYNRSLETVQSILNTTPSDIIIDLHRDAIGSNSNYAPTVKIGDEYAAQLMFVIGTNGGGLWHPNWNQNLKFAVKIQQKAEELYPGLFKNMIVRNSRYNQHLGKYASIIEVGATGNTLEQCLTSMKYLAKVIDEAIN